MTVWNLAPHPSHKTDEEKRIEKIEKILNIENFSWRSWSEYFEGNYLYEMNRHYGKLGQRYMSRSFM